MYDERRKTELDEACPTCARDVLLPRLVNHHLILTDEASADLDRMADDGCPNHA